MTEDLHDEGLFSICEVNASVTNQGNTFNLEESLGVPHWLVQRCIVLFIWVLHSHTKTWKKAPEGLHHTIGLFGFGFVCIANSTIRELHSWIQTAKRGHAYAKVIAGQTNTLQKSVNKSLSLILIVVKYYYATFSFTHSPLTSFLRLLEKLPETFCV